MTKAQLIEKHGLEWYEQYKARSKERYRNDLEFRESEKARSNGRYQNNLKYRESHIIRTKARKKARYVKDGRIDFIENYELAKAEGFKDWDIHHRLELHPDCTVRFTMQSLIKLDLYYNRPPSELIWLRCSEHMRIHHKVNTKD